MPCARWRRREIRNNLYCRDNLDTFALRNPDTIATFPELDLQNMMEIQRPAYLQQLIVAQGDGNIKVISGLRRPIL